MSDYIDSDDEGLLPVPAHLRGAFAVLVAGLKDSPDLFRGLWITVVVSLAAAAAYLMVPLLVQQVFDHGFVDGELQLRYVLTLCGSALGIVMGAYFLGRVGARRLVMASEKALARLRVRAFEHIHSLSLATQSAERRGVFVARITADVDALSRFTEWGGLAWIISFALIVGSGALMLAYSWQLATPLFVLLAPMLWFVAKQQSRVTTAYDNLRGRVSTMLAEVSESVMGAAVIRAYGLEKRSDERVKRAIHERYDAQVVTHRRVATLWPMATMFWGVSMAIIVLLAETFHGSWGLTFGAAASFLFLADLFIHSFTDLPEIYGETQSAISGWRKILALLAIPIEVEEPQPGVTLPSGTPLAVVVDDLWYAYGVTPAVIRGITIDIPAGAHVAVVGQTGCGKSTFVKLLCRLADPHAGKVTIGGVDLREISRESRQGLIRMVPQDGFLFDVTIRENVRAGREGASDREVEAAFEELGLAGWLEALPHGLDTRVGERGEALSAGERQLVSLARAQISNPGILILDEATSAVDPGTERRISEALRRLSAGRTTITIAHRLSTAETADNVFVFEKGECVERGTHEELVKAGGVYTGLYSSWLGNVGSF